MCVPSAKGMGGFDRLGLFFFAACLVDGLKTIGVLFSGLADSGIWMDMVWWSALRFGILPGSLLGAEIAVIFLLKHVSDICIIC